MGRVLAAEFAVLAHFDSVGVILLVFLGNVVALFVLSYFGFYFILCLFVSNKRGKEKVWI